jgi:hypothetical protein
MDLRHHRVRTPRAAAVFQTAGLKGLAGPVAAALLCFQILAIVHLASSAHALTPITGKVVHPEGFLERGPRWDGLSARACAEECQVFTLLCRSQALKPPSLALAGASPGAAGSALPWAAANPLSVAELFRLAPARSPPSAAR